MDKLQKFFKGFWRYKERVLLVVLLGVLAYKVYQLFTPEPLPPLPAVAAGNAEKPPPPPASPPVDADGSYYSLLHRSPFSYYSDAKVGGKNRSGVEDLGVELLDMKPVGNKWRVKLKTPGAPHKWYDEGENFEEFVLEKINPEDKSVDIYAERIARTVTIRLR